jgi:hypothetical protein
VLAVVYLAAEVLHIALVPTLMFGMGPLPPLGITGAGVATVASFTASSAVLAWYITSGRTPIRLSLRGLRFDRRLFVEILRVGAPMSLQPVLNNLALATLTGFVAALGAAQLAGFGAAVRLEYLLYPLAFGLGAGVIAMVGTNIGAGNVKRADESHGRRQPSQPASLDVSEYSVRLHRPRGSAYSPVTQKCIGSALAILSLAPLRIHSSAWDSRWRRRFKQQADLCGQS